MRIIAGRLGGRTFVTPRSARTHPMGDKVRGALFNTLGDIEGLAVLDAFAGTGALSLEALSRGAASAVLIEIDKPAQRAIQESIAMLDLQSQAKLISASSSGWSDNNPIAQFDIVIADPPYDDLQLPVIQKLAKHVVDSGLFVLSWPGETAVPVIAGLEIVDQKSYGNAKLVFYR